MTKKPVFMIGALALVSVGIASAKTYDLHLYETTQVASTDLKAGNYKVKLDGSHAVFTDTENYKSVTTPVKIEKNNKKFEETMVETDKQNGMDKLREIDLGGSTTKLEFAD
jgi:translation elongation factor P/translation initiation factor 5A